MTSSLILLSALWIIWCLLHSLLITPSVVDTFRKSWGSWFAYYRLAYNLFSLLTVLPLWAYTRHLSTVTGWLWDWPYTLLQGALVLSGMGGLWAGARVYDLRLFAGFKQAAEFRAEKPQKDEPELMRNGILGIVRHPWYTAAMLLLWARRMDGPILVMTIILSAYLAAGAFLEERKLIITFGRAYREYQGEVSMFFPFKWLLRKIRCK